MIPSSGPCVPLELDTTCFDVPADTPQATIDAWQRVASEYLRAMTGNHYGQSCPVIVRPCYGPCSGQGDGYGWWYGGGPMPLASVGQPFYPYLGRDGGIRNWRGCGCGDKLCHCGENLCRLPLPGPIHTITGVWINGHQLANDFYTVQDAKYLVRSNVPGTPGPDPDIFGDCWPTCQDFTDPIALDETSPVGTHNTFFVEYTTGLRTPDLLRMAMSHLTAHFIRGCSGCGCGSGTRENLSRLSRQGVELEFADAQQVFQDGRTGIEVVDFAIRALNPSGLPRAMRVLSPDMNPQPTYRG